LTDTDAWSTDNDELEAAALGAGSGSIGSHHWRIAQWFLVKIVAGSLNVGIQQTINSDQPLARLDL